jgi:hypothetical protein
MMVTDSAALAVRGLDGSIFICNQSYGNTRGRNRGKHMSGYQRCRSAAPQFAAHADGEAAPFVPTTEDQIEQTHTPLLD